MEKKSVVFLIHARDHQDLIEKSILFKFISPKITAYIFKHLTGKFGYIICDKINVFDELDVYLVGVLLYPHQIIPKGTSSLKFVRNRILEAVLFSQNKLNATVIGLGALTASVTDGGKWLVKKNSINAKITHGDTLSVIASADSIKQIAKMHNIENCKIAIVGAYGIIGSGLSRIFNEKYNLILMGRNKNKIKRLQKSLSGNVEITTDINKIIDADIIVTATSHPTSLMKSEYLKKGAIIYDVAQPANVSKKLLDSRPDLKIYDGGLVKIPKININFNLRTGNQVTFACLAETILTGLENISIDLVGNIELRNINLITQYANKYNFSHYFSESKII